jgi:large subunit ribosomal protein L28
MSRKCKLTGKGPMSGNLVSHANNRTKHWQIPNLQRKKIYVEELGRMVRVRLSARALRTVSRKGLMTYLRERGLTVKDVEC